MVVTSTDFKNNIRKYMELSKKENIIVTKNGKDIAKLIGVKNSETPLTDSLIGIIKTPEEINLEQEREERLKYLFKNVTY
ncbi:MAG: type II toxin-antitoxin system prevent-host-death family antitoxin [Candidatus Eremiobacterota bacterium]